MTSFFKRITGSELQGDANTTVQVAGTIVIDSNNALRIHDGTTAGGIAIGATTSNLINGSYTVQLDADGYINLPNGADTQGAVLQSMSPVRIISNAHTWAFGSNGTLTVAGEIQSVSANGSVAVNSTDGSNTYTWVFGANSSLTVPGTIKSKIIDQVGLQVSTGEPNFGYGGFNACFDTNTFTGGSFSDIQVGWTVTDNQGFSDTITAINNPSGGFLTTGVYEWPTDGGRTYVFSSPDFVAATPTNLVLQSNSAAWTLSPNGHITFPDNTVQTTAYYVASIPPSSPWGTVLAYDSISFVFDATYGFPSFGGGYGLGSGSYNTLLWKVDIFQNAGNPTNATWGVTIPTQYFNYDGPTILTETTLTPGDYFVMHIQDIDNNRVYRATFLSSYNAADTGNEQKYGSITVERLI